MQLTGSSRPIPLGNGYALRAPGLVGTVDLVQPATSQRRSLADGTPAFDAALAAADMHEVRRIELQVKPLAPGARQGRSAAGDTAETVELQVPALDADHGVVVLACDETGVLTWHLPADPGPAVDTGVSRGAGEPVRFLIPLTPSAPAAQADGGERSLLGLLGRKLLKVLVYPITDPIVGALGSALAGHWESTRRPYGLRSFTPQNRREPGAGALGEADWARLSQGRALLFVHGTFSTSHAAFDLLPDDVFDTLTARYGSRVFAFDHFTLSHDPQRNVEWFFAQLPAGCRLELDIICHSRGGLVSRLLAERPCAFELDNSRVDVRRVVLVAVPNRGTVLAHPDHVVHMIDRLTTVLNLFPTGPVAETLEALVTAVKVVAHGALKGLDGLAAMRPEGTFLNRFNGHDVSPPADGARYCAVAADYEPSHAGLRSFLAGSVADGVLDRVFEGQPNDLIVPVSGVHEAIDGNGSFPIDEADLLRIPPEAGVIHTTLFGHPGVNASILQWLN